MATVSAAHSSSQSVTISLASLANNTAVASSAIDNSSNLFLGAAIQVKLKSGASGVSATGYANIYLVRSVDGGTTYDDNTATLIGVMDVIANATTYIKSFSTEPFGTLPKWWKIVVQNVSGAALDATGGNHSVVFEGIKQTVA